MPFSERGVGWELLGRLSKRDCCVLCQWKLDESPAKARRKLGGEGIGSIPSSSAADPSS